MENRADIFKFLLDRVGEVALSSGFQKPQAFISWFVHLYFSNPQEIFVSDGSHDGKVDAFFKTNNGVTVAHHVVNSKFTQTYNKAAPPAFYAEVAQFSNAFSNAGARESFLESWVKEELRSRYRQLFQAYDDERADLMFVTNHKLDDRKHKQLSVGPLRLFDLDDLIHHVVDDIDGAMPRTPDLVLSGIHSVLSPDEADTEVSTSIAFARLIDFISYMQADPYDLLFARNVRVPLSFSASETNRDIRDTFRDEPREFAYSNNGITVLCERHEFDPGTKELTVVNPRVVNGSQSLHSIRDVPNPSRNARVMLRIIVIPPLTGRELPDQIRRRKNVISNITIRSNQQNPMKKWSLVSNDDFQMDLYRFFRQRGLFYERRDREWSRRSRELRSVGIRRGPGIKKMAQLIASYYSNRKLLGPARAKQSVAKLFAGKAYEQLRVASPELAYQLYVVNADIDEAADELAEGIKYVRDLRGHADLALLALVTKSLSDAGARWGHPEFSRTLDDQWEQWDAYLPKWKTVVQLAMQRIHSAYQNAARRSETEMTFNNFFKAETHVSKLLDVSLRPMRKSARQLT